MAKKMNKKLNQSKNKIMKSIKGNKKIFKSAKKNLKSRRAITVITLIALLAVLALGVNMNRFLLNTDSNKVVAVVDEDEITANELDKSYDTFFFMTGYPDEYRQLITRESFLEQMVNERVLLHEAADMDVIVQDSEVEAELASMLENSPVTEDEFKAGVEEAGISVSNIKDYIKNQMIITRLLNETVPAVDITDEESKAYYDNNSESYIAGDGQTRLRHILVDAQEEAENILIQLKKGKDFAKLAEEKSTCPSASNGGDLGFVSRGQMVPEFEDAAFKLNVNQLSAVVETQFGFHIIKREPSKIYFSEANDDIKEMLAEQKQKEMFADYMGSLKEGVEITINLEEETEATDTAVVEAAADEGCIGDYGLDPGTVVFYHSDSCPHCSRMVPIVNELSEEGYSFHSAETTSGEGVDAVKLCLSDVLQGAVPQFICAGSKEYKLGAMSKEALKAFADDCQ